MNPTLEELLDRCRAGDQEAISLLVRRFESSARSLASALLADEELAKDAVQEAFITALERLPDLRSPAAFPAWLRQIVRTHATRITRKRREIQLDDTQEPGSEAGSPRRRLLGQELLETVQKALCSLPEPGRETAELYYFEERTCSEIATTLRIPEGTVKRRLHDVRRRLRAILLGYIGNEPPPSGERTEEKPEWPL